MVFEVIDVARYILETETTLPPIKLQKLCFYTQCFHLVIWGAPLFDGDFEKWKDGPVHYCTWKTLRPFCSNVCSYDISDVDFPGDSSKIPSQDKDLIKAIVQLFKNNSCRELSKRTRDEDPWINVQYNRIIENQSMKEFYSTNDQAMIDLVGCLCFIGDDSLKNDIVVAVQQYITRTNASVFDIYDTIVDQQQDLETNLSNKFKKWRKQSQLDALVCKLFMPAELVTLDRFNSYYKIPSIIDRVQICAKAKNPLAQYHLHVFMKPYLSNLLQDNKDGDSDDDVIPEKYKAIKTFIDELYSDCNSVKFTDAENLFEAGCLMWLLFRRPEAKQAFETANTTEAFYTLGELYKNKEYYLKALQINPNNFKANARLLECEGKRDEAIEVLKKVKDNHPDANVLLYYMTSDKKETFEEKIEYLVEAAKKWNDSTLYETAALVCRNKRKYNEAFKFYEEAAGMGNPHAYFEMWQMKKKQRKDTDVETYKEKAHTGGYFCFGDTDKDIEMIQEEVFTLLHNIQRFVEEGV